MNIFLHLLRIIGLWLLCWPVYRRSLHMYQLCSYQNFSYRKYLRENKPETYSAKRIVPAVLGGACIVLYGMIASVGLRQLVENKVDFKKNRNLCIAAVMMVLAIGGAVIGSSVFNLKGIGLGIIVGIILNLILPEGKTEE